MTTQEQVQDIPQWAKDLIEARRRKAAIREMYAERREHGLQARHQRKEAR